MSTVCFPFANMLFVWDEEKAIANWKKHKVTFESAAKVLRTNMLLFSLILNTVMENSGRGL